MFLKLKRVFLDVRSGFYITRANENKWPRFHGPGKIAAIPTSSLRIIFGFNMLAYLHEVSILAAGPVHISGGVDCSASYP